MSTGIFSRYSTGENRVTAAIVAVLGSLSLARTQRLLGALLEDPEFPFVVMENQPSRGGAGVPDAEISGSFRILVETKTAFGAVDAAQLPRAVVDRIRHYFLTYKSIPGESAATITVDPIYDAAQSRAVLLAAQADYEAEFAHR